MTRTPTGLWLMDMDGVLIREQHPIPGADRFLIRLRELGRRFLVITNNSIYTPRDLSARLRRSGLEVPEDAIWTSALATARFLSQQRPGGTAFVIGEWGLTTALHEVGYTLSDIDPDYVVLGETRTYSFERVTRAIRRSSPVLGSSPPTRIPRAVPGGAASGHRLGRGPYQSCQRVAPYFVGKPNPLMMRSALNALGAHSESTVMIGDRMDTDVVAGIEAGMETILVLSGVTSRKEAERFPYRASRIVDSVADLIDELT